MGDQRTRPLREEWDEAMDRLLVAHEVHGGMPWHVLVAVGHELRVAPDSVATRYRCFLQRLEGAHGPLTLNATERDLIRGTATFGAAHRVLEAFGRLTPFALFDRAIWRDAGDRDLLELYQAEAQRRTRAALDVSECPMCSTATKTKAAA